MDPPELPNSAGTGGVSAEDSIRALSDAFGQTALSSPLRYPSGSAELSPSESVNQPFDPEIEPNFLPSGPQNGNLSAFDPFGQSGGDPFDHGGASILQSARDVLEHKMNMAQHTAGMSSPISDENQQFGLDSPARNTSIFGSQFAPIDGSGGSSGNVWAFRPNPSRDDIAQGRTPAPILAERPWNTLPRSFGDSSKSRPSLLDNGLFPAPELVPTGYPQNPPSTPTAIRPSTIWGPIGGDRREDRGSFSSAFMPTPNVTLRKKTSAPILQSGQTPTLHRSRPSLSPTRYPFPPPTQTSSHVLQNVYESSQERPSGFAVGMPQRSRGLSSPTRRSNLSNMSMYMMDMRGALEEDHDENCGHKKQLESIQLHCDYLQRLLDKAELNAKLQHEEAVRRISSLEAQMSAIVQDNARLLRELSLQKLNNSSIAPTPPPNLNGMGGNVMVFKEKPAVLDDSIKHFEAEFTMLYRTLNCWSSRYLQFPNGEQVPPNLAERIHEFLTTPELYGLLLSDKTKAFVVTALMARRFEQLIFHPEFIRRVVQEYKRKTVEQPTMERNEDAIDAVVSAQGESIGAELHELIVPLLSRVHDATALEGSRKALISMMQQAARLAFKMNRASDKVFRMIFPQTGELFRHMLMTNAENHQCYSQATAAEIDLERKGAKVKLASLPFICLADKNQDAQIIIYKASVLLI